MASPRDGFTLLEVIVALVVVGLVLVTLTQGVHFGVLAWRSHTRLAVANGDLNEVDQTLRNLIEAVDPGKDGQDRPTLLAESGAMTFITDLPNAGGSVPSRHVEAMLFVDSGHRLVLRWRPLSAAQGDPTPPSRETEILRNVSQVRFAFWRRTGDWVSEWRSNDLPAMVRIHLAFIDDKKRHWPDIVVAPLLDRL
jgi:general secretion pathway protein J